MRYANRKPASMPVQLLLLFVLFVGASTGHVISVFVLRLLSYCLSILLTAA
jgi:hypothetical protein